MEAEEVDDAALLKRAAGGDEDAFTQLMRRHEDRIFALASRITGDRHDALDATQDTFISAFRRAGSFRGESQFSTWLYRIAVNASKDVLRRKSRSPVPQEDDITDQGRSSTDRSIDDQVIDRMQIGSALAALPEEYRAAVAMHDLGGIPYEEISRLTGAAIGTVKSRISRGRKQLAELLEQGGRLGASKEET
ncbi:MAG: RNA polymerase sigma factor [Actinomycetota bacterium]